MSEHGLGPNAALVYCMDYLEKNIDLLQSKLKLLAKGFIREDRLATLAEASRSL